MSELESPVKYLATEIESTNFPNLHFEAGDHNFKYPSFQGWNPEIKDVLAAYSPQVLAVDGLQPFSHRSTKAESYILSNLRGLGSVKSFSPNNEAVYLICGDPGFTSETNQQVILKFWQSRQIIPQEQSQKLITGMKQQNQYIENKISQPRYDEIISNLAMIAAMAVGQIGTDALSRRDFVKLLVKVPTTISMVALGLKLPVNLASSYMAAYNTNPQVRENAKRIVTITKPYFQNLYWWENGRTAIEIAKTMDTIETLEKSTNTQAAVLMGNAHAVNSQEYLTDNASLNKGIKDYFTNYWGAIEAILIDTDVDNDTINKCKETAINYISLTDIVKLTANQETKQDDLDFILGFRSKRVLDAIK